MILTNTKLNKFKKHLVVKTTTSEGAKILQVANKNYANQFLNHDSSKINKIAKISNPGNPENLEKIPVQKNTKSNKFKKHLVVETTTQGGG